ALPRPNWAVRCPRVRGRRTTDAGRAPFFPPDADLRHHRSLTLGWIRIAARAYGAPASRRRTLRARAHRAKIESAGVPRDPDHSLRSGPSRASLLASTRAASRRRALRAIAHRVVVALGAVASRRRLVCPGGRFSGRTHPLS